MDGQQNIKKRITSFEYLYCLNFQGLLQEILKFVASIVNENYFIVSLKMIVCLYMEPSKAYL